VPKRIFIAFAKEDERMRNLLKGQSLNAGSPFEYVDMSVKQPYSAAWKQRTRARIRGSSGVIALISKNTLRASGQIWEIQCAITEKKPLLGMWIYRSDRTQPKVMEGKRVVMWTWPAVTNFIRRV
jgi:hypothetical protein